MKRKIPLYAVAIILLCLLGMLIGLFPGYRFSAGICFGIAVLIGVFQLLVLLGKTHPKLSKILKTAFSLCLSLGILAAAITGAAIMGASYGRTERECGRLIVLGAGVNGTVPSLSLRERLDAAYDYLQEHPNTICVVSGGQGSGEDISEAECMYRYLVEKGIESKRIYKEDRSTSTEENMKFSLDIIKEKDIDTVYFMTDGMPGDNFNDQWLLEQLKRHHLTKLKIHCISVGMDQQFMKKIADHTHGKYIYIP
jgi:uncharacterized SAM-binding protein YcdF (DUF218 family)